MRRNLLPDTKMAKVSVIRLEMTFLGRVRDGSDADTTVSLAGKTITEFQFHVRNVVIACVVQVTTYLSAPYP